MPRWQGYFYVNYLCWSLVARRLPLEFGGWETASGVWWLGDCFWSLAAERLLLEFGG